MKRCASPGLLLFCFVLSSCVTEEVRDQKPARPQRFRWPVPVLPSAVYHGVRLYFEVDPEKDLSAEELAWMEREGAEGSVKVQLGPPQLESDGILEIYRYKQIHQVEYFHNMFHVGKARYPPMHRGSLYVFKERAGSFTFTFRGHEIVVPFDGRWIPSVYYYAEDYAVEAAPAEQSSSGRARYTREVLQIGSAKIETVPHKNVWLVRGIPYYPSAKKPLELQGTAHRIGQR